MSMKPTRDLRETLIDAHAHFFFLKGAGALRVRLWQIQEGSIIIDTPKGVPMRRTVLGYIPTLDGNGVYEIEGTVNPEPLPDQIDGTLRIDIDSSRVRKLNRRLYPRYHFTPPLEGSVTLEGEKKSTPIKIVNFSAGGLRIESSRELVPTGTHIITFRVELDGEIHDLKLKGSIVYKLPTKSGHLYGIKFLARGMQAGEKEASVEALDQTVDLLGLVNKLLVREG